MVDSAKRRRCYYPTIAAVLRVAKYAAGRRGLGQFGVALAKPRNTPSPRSRGEGRGEGPSGRVAGRFIRAQQGGIVDFPDLPNGWSQERIAARRSPRPRICAASALYRYCVSRAGQVTAGVQVLEAPTEIPAPAVNLCPSLFIFRERAKHLNSTLLGFPECTLCDFDRAAPTAHAHKI
jgi:hypothetical protein